MGWTKTGFDFEAMARLAKDDPTGFAGAREELIRRLIGGSSPSSQLARLQLDIDAARYGVPPGAQAGARLQERMLQITASMTDHVAQLSDLLERAAGKREP